MLNLLKEFGRHRRRQRVLNGDDQLERMRLAKIAEVLSSPLKREILMILCKQDSAAIEVFHQLGSVAPKYRQSVNKALESLRQSGLVKKYYDEEKKKLYYGIVTKKITINLETMSILPISENKGN